MEKYSQDQELLLRQLQDEEHQLLQRVGELMSSSEKTADEEKTLAHVEGRLTQVRNKITDMVSPA